MKSVPALFIGGLMLLAPMHTAAATMVSPLSPGNTATAVSSSVPHTIIPVLCYHRFGPDDKNGTYSISVEEFSRQLDIIKEEGFQPIRVSQLLAARRGEATLPKKPLLITVDDGYRDFLEQAEPLLQKHQFPATLFIYTNFVGARLGLSTKELAALEKAGYEIGSHTVSHPKLNRRRKKETKEAWEKRIAGELAGSRKKLQAWSGGKVIALAYPYGLWNQDVAAIAKKAGYALLFTVNPGPNSLTTASYCLRRTMILRGTRETTFRAILHEHELPVVQWMPPRGEAVAGPIQHAGVVIAPDFREKLDGGTLKARVGQRAVATTYDQKSGKVTLTFKQPWERGTNLIVITAQDRGAQATYKQSWLFTVQPAL